jgi:hypothetical protein
MTDLPDLIGDAEEGRSLRAQARLNEIDRRTSALSFRLGFLRWLVLPVFGVALVAMVGGLLLGFGAPQELIGGIIGIVGGTAGFIHWVGQLRDEVFDLEEERASVTGNLPGASGEVGGLIDGSS